MKLSIALQNDIIQFLKSLPIIDDNKKRQAFLYSANLDEELQAQLPFDEPVAQFVPILINVLLQYGKLRDGREALDAILETSKHFIGNDRWIEECEPLIEGLRSLRFKERKSNFYRRKELKDKIFLFRFEIIILGIFIIILFILRVDIKHWLQIQVSDFKVNANIFFKNTQVITTPTIEPISSKEFYQVNLVLPSKMSGAKISIDNSEAFIIKETPIVVMVQIEKKLVPYRITVKKGEVICQKVLLIEKNEMIIYPCQ